MHARRPVPALGRVLLFGLLAALLAGCGGPDYKARATVTGKVTYEGKLLPVGTVVFHGSHNMTGNAKIEEGYYVMRDAPIGEVRITVSVPKVPMMGVAHLKGAPTGPVPPGQTPPDPETLTAKIVPIPKRYAQPETSGLTYTVETGEHKYDIPLSK